MSINKRHQNNQIIKIKQHITQTEMGLGKTYVGSEKAVSMNANIILTVCQKSKIQDWFNHFNEHYECRLYDLTNKKDFVNFKDLFKWKKKKKK